jgi:hypothetical protein
MKSVFRFESRDLLNSSKVLPWLFVILFVGCSGSSESSKAINGDDSGNMASDAAAGATAARNPDGSPIETESATSALGVGAELVFQSQIKQSDNASVALNLAAPVALVLGPEALEGIYRPVFGDSPRRGTQTQWFAGVAGIQRVQENPKFRFFSPTEFVNLGGTVLGTVWELRAPGLASVNSRIAHRPSLDTQYLASLRNFLGDACRNLLSKEIDSGEDATDNLLYSGESIQASRLSLFLRALTGLPAGPTSNVDAYAAAFAALLPDPMPPPGRERDAAVRLAYQHVCVAVASDMRVITR